MRTFNNLSSHTSIIWRTRLRYVCREPLCMTEDRRNWARKEGHSDWTISGNSKQTLGSAAWHTLPVLLLCLPPAPSNRRPSSSHLLAWKTRLPAVSAVLVFCCFFFSFINLSFLLNENIQQASKRKVFSVRYKVRRWRCKLHIKDASDQSEHSKVLEAQHGFLYQLPQNSQNCQKFLTIKPMRSYTCQGQHACLRQYRQNSLEFCATNARASLEPWHLHRSRNKYCAQYLFSVKSSTSL